MKVLARNDDKFIIEVSSNELANIMGFSSQYNDSFKYDLNDIVKYQKNIEVSRIYKSHEALEYLKRNRYKEARERLTDMLKALEPIEELIKEVPVVVNR